MAVGSAGGRLGADGGCGARNGETGRGAGGGGDWGRLLLLLLLLLEEEEEEDARELDESEPSDEPELDSLSGGQSRGLESSWSFVGGRA